MNRCPTELCTYIFSYACVDNGTMGRSLSLVSRYVNEASKPARLQSIFVCGNELQPFLLMLDNLAPDVKRVRHLFLSDIDQVTADMLRATNKREKVQGGIGDDDGGVRSLMSMSCTGDEARPFYDCMIRILELNASTLRTLTLALIVTPHSYLFLMISL